MTIQNGQELRPVPAQQVPGFVKWIAHENAQQASFLASSLHEMAILAQNQEDELTKMFEQEMQRLTISREKRMSFSVMDDMFMRSPVKKLASTPTVKKKPLKLSSPSQPLSKGSDGNDASFEAITTWISYKKKQKPALESTAPTSTTSTVAVPTATANTNSTTPVNNNKSRDSESPFSHGSATGETESTDPNVVALPITEEELHEATSPEKEVAELSRMIEQHNDKTKLILEDDEDEGEDDDADFSVIVDPLEKIDIPGRKSIAATVINNSPIKFSSIPTIEPIVMDQSRKSLLKSTTASVASRMNSQVSIKSFETPKSVSKTTTRAVLLEEDSVFIDRSNTKIDPKNFKLELPPAYKLYSASLQNSPDDPTIKLNRGLKRMYKPETPSNNTKRALPAPSHISKPTVESSPARELEFLERISRPTQASINRLKGTKSPHKPVQNQKKDITPSKLVASQDPVEDSPTTVFEPLKGSPASKKSIPLTMKRLPSNSSDIRKSNGSVSGLSPSRRLLEHNMSKLSGQSAGHKRVISSSSSSDFRKNTAQANDLGKSRQEGIKRPEDLPEIHTGSHEESEAMAIHATWATKTQVLRLLQDQQRRNPVHIFGSIASIDADAVFGGRYGPGLSIKFRRADCVTQTEREGYERQMAFRN